MLLFNRYEYNPQTDLIGKGGFSRVYKALDKKFNRYLALKIYKTSDLSERYSPVAEIQRVIQLDHPNISRYIDIEEIEKKDSFGQEEKIQVCVMELLEGGNLAKYYEMHRDTEVFKKLLIDVLHGLSYLHRNGIIHRDIKPANILIKQNLDGPVAKITDFGISKKSEASVDSSSSGLIVSVPYMAPEQLNAQKYGIDDKVHYNIDLWSLGVAVYEILSGDVLFKNNENDSSEQIMSNIITSDIPVKINSLPEPFRAFVSKCVIKDAKERVKTADELLSILQPATTEAPNKTTVVKKQAKTTAKNKPAADPVQPVKEIKPQAPVAVPVDPDPHDDDLPSPDDTTEISRPKKTEALEEMHDPKTGTDESDDDDTRIIKKPVVEIPAEEHTKPIKKEPAKEDTPVAAKEESPSLPVTQNEKEQGKVTLFNRYDYYPAKDLIGKGGFSRVYKAMDQKLGRWVALKIYKTSEFSDRHSPIAEIKRVVNLDHPNICRYLDIEEIEKLNAFGEAEKIQICVMELLDSGNFLEYFNNNGRNLDTLKKLLEDVLNGISYLHKNGIIHRDIKPANILIKKTIEGPAAKITDFGISKVSDSVNNNSSSALIVSIPYMAPEQFNTKKYGIDEKISFNLDLWSLGVTIYEVITGKVLFKNSEQDSSEQIMANIMAPELPEKINELPHPFRNVVSHCIIKNANERAQKAEELLVLLNTSKPEPVAPPVVPVAPVSPVQTAAPVTVIAEAPVAPKPAAEAEIKKPEPVAVAAEKTEQPALKRKFLIAEATPEIEKRSKKHINWLRISIAAAVVLLAVASFFYFKKSSDENKLNDTAVHKDTTKNTVVSNEQTENIKTPATDTAGSKKAVATTLPTTKEEPLKNIPIAGTEKKDPVSREKNGPNLKEITAVKQDKKNEVQQSKTVAEIKQSTNDGILSSKKYILNMVITEPCTLTQDGINKGEFKSAGKIQILLEVGKHTISAVNKDGRTWSRSIDINNALAGKKATWATKF